MESLSAHSPEKNEAHWHILGAGSIGCLWAAHLLESGQKVTLLLRDIKSLNAFLQQGRITLERNEEHFSFPANAQLCAEKSNPIKCLLVCTKSFDALKAVQSVKHRITLNTRIIVLQNGMGAQQAIANLLPYNIIICGTTTDGVFRRSPYNIVFAGQGLTRFGFYNKNDNERLNKISDEVMNLITKVKLKTAWDEDIQTHLWHKLAINCVINPITAIKQCKNGQILNNEQDLSLIKNLCSEIKAVMSKASISDFQPSLYENVLTIARSTGENYSSMHQDIANGNQTEIEAISGFLCHQAAKLNIQVPTNQRMYESILALQSHNQQD